MAGVYQVNLNLTIGRIQGAVFVLLQFAMISPAHVLNGKTERTALRAITLESGSFMLFFM